MADESSGRKSRKEASSMASDQSDRPLKVTEDNETGSQFVVYTTKSGSHLELQFDGEEPWFTQKDLATAFGVDVRTVNDHIQGFMDAGEFDESTIREFRIVRQEGSRTVARSIQHYGLDTAFYVGYRVNSTEGKLFRRWATQMLIQIAKHGFVVDKRMLRGESDRLAKLREIIRELRADEANVYAELRQILSMCKDYDPHREVTRLFFANFQNRLLYAITSHTSAELKQKRADASKPNMGLQSWHEDNDHPLQQDVLNSKNYLGQLELEDLNRLVSMVLDFFEDQTKRGWLVSMNDANARLLDILTVNKRKMLPDLGKISAKEAEQYAKAQYKVFDAARRAERKARAIADLNANAKALPRTGKKKG
jgi:hypothetical protein